MRAMCLGGMEESGNLQRMEGVLDVPPDIQFLMARWASQGAMGRGDHVESVIRWVHGLPWLGYVTLPAKLLEPKCSREPAWGTLGT